ncbi:MAG: hypothetical protein IIT70_00740, partial [Clostridia bacterium]|nr:hypothetical protein [Clostridia bacterium]
ILSIVATSTGLLGIIFGAIGKSKAKAFAAANDGVLVGKAKVGKILSTLGFVFGIIAFVFVIILVVLCITNPEIRQAVSAEYGF